MQGPSLKNPFDEEPSTQYEIRYRELLAISRHSRISEIFEGIPLTSWTQIKAAFAGDTLNTLTFIEKKIYRWIKLLCYDEQFVRINLESLEKLQAIVRTIIQKDTLKILEELLKKDQLWSSHYELTWLNNSLVSIMTPHAVPSRSFPERLHSPLSHLSAVESTQLDLKYKMLHARLERSEDSVLILDLFKNIHDASLEGKLLNRLNYSDLISVIRNLYEAWTPDELVSAIGELSTLRFQWIVHSLDDMLIPGLRTKIQLASREAILSLKCETLPKHFQHLIAQNNHIKEQIDTLNRQLHTERLNFLTNVVSKINELAHKIEEQRQIIHHLERVIRDFSLTRSDRDLIASLTHEYNRLIFRISYKYLDCSKQEPGSTYPLIYAIAFDYFEDDDKAEDAIFTVWNITSIEEYVQTGIFEDSAFFGVSLTFNMIPGLLEKYGLRTVLDLKKNNIFNKTLLANFITRKQELDLNKTSQTPADAAKP